MSTPRIASFVNRSLCTIPHCESRSSHVKPMRIDLTAQAKALIDRSQALWARKYVLKQKPPNGTRKGAFIAVGATKGDKLFEGSILTVRYFFNTIGVKYSDELLIRGVDKKGEIKEHVTALRAAFELGERLARTSPD